jgi:hypothetical protein
MCNRTEVLLRIQQRKGRNFNVKEEELMRKIGILLKEMACSRRLLSSLGIRGAKNF